MFTRATRRLVFPCNDISRAISKVFPCNNILSRAISKIILWFRDQSATHKAGNQLVLNYDDVVHAEESDQPIVNYDEVKLHPEESAIDSQEGSQDQLHNEENDGEKSEEDVVSSPADPQIPVDDAALSKEFEEVVAQARNYAQMAENYGFMVNMMPESVKLSTVNKIMEKYSKTAANFFALSVDRQTKIATDVLSKDPLIRKQLNKNIDLISKVKQFKHLNMVQILKDADARASG